jgi:hypothetical protein
MTLPAPDEEPPGVEPETNDGLPQVNPPRPPEDQDKVRLGQEAMARRRRGWDDWVVIGEAIEVGRTEAMREANTNEPVGRRYERAMAKWLVDRSFKEIDKGIRALLERIEAAR